jgi:MFS family permease
MCGNAKLAHKNPGRNAHPVNTHVTTELRRGGFEAESPYAWWRLAVAVLLSTVGGVGMWSYQVALPAVEAEFGLSRALASLPFTWTMLGFGLGGIIVGRFSDRFGIMVPVMVGAVVLCLGYVTTGLAATYWQYAIAHGVLIGLGCSSTFAPLVADISLWFTRRRGIAVGICASGNYFAGVFWPPIVQHFIETDGWRATHIGIGIFVVVAMLPLALVLRRRAQFSDSGVGGVPTHASPAVLGLKPVTLQILLSIAGVGCCVAMSMPQVHIVAYCGELGYGVARGAEMLSVMMAFGIISRIGSGFFADRFGGLATLMLGSVLQGVALCLYVIFNGLTSLYVVSALFGLFQGGIVPSYAIIVREFFSPREAATRLGTIVMATVVGMAFGGWVSGAIFDWTSSYRAAFANGVAWNLLNFGIVLFLMRRSGGFGSGRRALAAA